MFIPNIYNNQNSYRNKMTNENIQILETIFEKCPICKKGKVRAEEKSRKILGFFKLTDAPKIRCDNCHAHFIEENKKEDDRLFRLDLSESKEKKDYNGEALKVSEWKRGLSDLDYYQKNDSLPNTHIVGLKIILPPNEKTHWYTSAKLMEERAIRRSHGGAVRVARGVYVGGSQSE